MAVRQQHMQDGGIVERRLRPIYDWLDIGNNKKALQEAEKVLKKSPTLQAARALKALALYRLGRAAEAQAVLDALVEEKPSDDSTLQAMTISYRESQQLNKVCALYEAAVKTEPKSEELHSHLFMSYVRVGDFNSQQRAAMALYKFAPKNPYYFWAVMSIVLQAKNTEDKTKKGVLLALAQRMVDNFINENKIEAEQEARLYIMILELQEKWEDILKFIEGPLYAKLVPGSIGPACIPYLKKLGHWSRLNLLCKELLCDNQDRWDYYLPYFDSVFELIKEKNTITENNVDDTAEKCHEFICQLVESMTSGKTLRGPYLARLELWKRLSEDGDPTSLLGSGVALCVQYLRVFAHKACAVPDLRAYLAIIPQKERESHCRDFLTCLGFDENSEPDNLDDIQRHISCVSAWFLTSPVGGSPGELAKKLRGHYLTCKQKGLVNATITEFCAPDGYALLAAHQYFYDAMKKKSSLPIVEALGILEMVLHYSPANHHVKLLLVQFYHILGNALAADSVYVKLEIKHIQSVSLGWLHAARATSTPSRRNMLLAHNNNTHTHHAKDSVEHLTYAYKYGTFVQLVELYWWRARLERCAWCGLAHRDRSLAALLASPRAAPVDLPALPADPLDNRDLNVIVSWEPPETRDPNLKTRTFEQEVAYLRLKDGLVSAVTLCTELADNRPVHEKRPHYEQLKTCISAFSEAMVKCKEVYGEKESISIAAPFPSRIIAFVNSPVPYRELYYDSFSLTAELSIGNVANFHQLCEKVSQQIEGIGQYLDKETKVEGDPGWNMREALDAVSNYLEYLGVIAFVLVSCYELVTPPTTKKPKKKTNQSPEELKTSKLLNQLNVTVQKSLETMECYFDKLPSYKFDTSLENEIAKLSIDKYECPVKDKISAGQQDMVNDVKNILQKKVKYLKCLS